MEQPGREASKHEEKRHYRRAIGTIGLTLCLIGLGATPIAASAAYAAKAKAKAPVYLACPCALSGPYASFEVPIYDGILAGAAMVNAEGGVLGGRKLVVVSADDTSDPTKAVTALQQLLTSYHIAGLFADVIFMGSQFPYADQYHIPAFSAATGPYFLPTNTGYPYAFNNYAGGLTQLPQTLAAVALLNPHPQVAVITDTVASNIQLGQEAVAGMKAEGIPVVDQETVSSTATDISVQVDAALSHNPNEILLRAASLPCEAVGNALTVADHPGVAFIVGSGCAVSTLLPEIPVSAGGDQIWVMAWPIQIESGKYHGPLPKYQKFAHLLQKISGSLAGLFDSAEYADTVSILAWAMDKAGVPSGAKVLAAMQTLHKVKLPTSGVGSTLVVPNPEWSPTVHDLSKANLSHYFALIRGGAQVDGTNPGVALLTKPLPPGL